MKLTILKFEYDDDRGEFCGVKIPKSFECEDNLMQADVINDVINLNVSCCGISTVKRSIIHSGM